MLPELTDEWVADNHADVDTVEAWTANIRDNISANKAAQMRRDLIGKVTAALTSLTDIETPDALVDSDLRNRVDATVRQFQAQGVEHGPVPRRHRPGRHRLRRGPARPVGATRSRPTSPCVRSPPPKGSTVDDSDLDNEYQRIALQVNQKPNQVRKAYESNDLVRNLEAQIRKGKALDWLLHHVEYVDETGETLPLDLVLGHGHDADGNHLPADESDDDVDPDDDTQTDDDAPAVAADSTDTPTTGESADTEA